MANNHQALGQSVSWNITAANDTVTLQLVENAASAVINVAGTFAATLQFEGGTATLGTGITWASLDATPIPADTPVTSTTAPGTWRAVVSGLNYMRIRCSGYTSGLAYVTISASLGSATGANVTSFNSLTGDVTISAGSGITLTPSGQNTAISYSGASATPGGSNGQLQYNNSGAFGGVAASNWDGSNLLLSFDTGSAGLETDSSAVFVNGSSDSGAASDVSVEAGGSKGIVIDATGDADFGGTGTGPVQITSAGDLTLTVNSITVNSSTGVSGSGATMTNVTVVNGIITAATFT